LAVGVGAPPRVGYVPHLFAYLHGVPHAAVTQVTNLARGGETSVSFMLPGGQLDRALAVIADPTLDVRMVTLDIGGNDLLDLLGTTACQTDPAGAGCQQSVRTALLTFSTNFPGILLRLGTALAARGDARLAVMTYYNPFSGTGSRFEQPVQLAMEGSDGVVDCAADQTDISRVGLNDVIACTAAQMGVTVADVYPLFLGRSVELTHIAEGDIHPNAAGYATIARSFEAALR
ncbi:MAG TPA: GDSL-type esterase/lipase family protein, partial [Chloroflexota bacterium]